MPIALTDHQLQLVMTAASHLGIEKRACFLERVAAELGRVSRLSNHDVGRAVRVALRGSMHGSAA